MASRESGKVTVEWSICKYITVALYKTWCNIFYFPPNIQDTQSIVILISSSDDNNIINSTT